MSISGGKPMTRSLMIDRPIQVRQYGEERNLLLELRPEEASDFLHLLLAIDFGIIEVLGVAGSDNQVRVSVARGGSDEARAVIHSDGTSWSVKLSSHEMQYWCHFLVEVVTGVAAVDHVDVEAASPSRSLTLRVMTQVVGVDAAEASRRLGQ